MALDEADCLRGMGGSKTFRELLNQCDDARVRYRFVATATPSPNDYEELLAYAQWLGVMDISQAKTRFFQRDSEKADNLTLRPHKVAEFWAWVCDVGPLRVEAVRPRPSFSRTTRATRSPRCACTGTCCPATTATPARSATGSCAW
jgi:hypothetical protein